MRTLIVMLASLILGACSSYVDRVAAQNGMSKLVAEDDSFRHVVFIKTSNTNDNVLHVYFESDGRPWINGGRHQASDPTPRDPLALKLMAVDAANTAYVGRPCYFGLASDPGCNASVWTFGRYSPEVVGSMAEAVRGIIKSGAYREVILIGYSGGGVIARLVAPHIPETIGLLTIAANLDTAAWTALHGYLPLSKSLNPATEDPLPKTILHVQAIGGKDQLVPPCVTDAYRNAGHQLEVWLYGDFEHRCCWVREWQYILEKFDRSLNARHERLVSSRR